MAWTLNSSDERLSEVLDGLSMALISWRDQKDQQTDISVMNTIQS
jgi:hypothetical protein